MTPELRFTISAIGLPIILVMIAAMFIRDVRLIRRREPIKSWFSDAVMYPDDPRYSAYVLMRIAPYLVPILLVLVIGGILIAAQFSSPQP
jgi:hypothetical protein